MRTQSARRAGVPVIVGLVVLALILLVVRLADPAGEGESGGGSGTGSVGDGGSDDGASGGDGPPPLRLGSYVPTAKRAADTRVTLSGDLPDGPDAAPVYRLTPAGVDAGSRLATALGLAGEPTTDGEGRVRTWTNERGDAQLVVEDWTGQWSYTAFVGGTVSSDGAGSGAGAGTGAGRATDPDAPVSSGVAPRDQDSISPDTTVEQALATAGRLADRAGLDLPDPVTGADGPWVTVGSDRVVGGLAAAGLATSVTVRGSTVQAADGWLVDPREGPTYDVVGASEAFDLLRRAAVPMPMMACPDSLDEPQQSPPCGEQPAATVTGARFGLSVQWEEVRPVLVPSWLFTIEGSDLPLVQVAVDPALLATPDEPPVAPSTGGGGSSGSPGTVEPVPAEPPSTEPAPDAPVSQFSAVTRSDDDLAVQVRFWGGVAECNDYRVLAEESADIVALRLEQESVGAGPCIELAQEHERTVRLAEPLGLRRVVDAETGAVLLGPTR